MAIPLYWHLQNTGVFCGNLTAFLPIASHWLFSWYQASTSLHDSISPELLTATEAAFLPMTSPGLSQCQAQLSITPSGLQNQYHLVTLMPWATRSRYNFGHLWTQLLCDDSPQETLARFHLNIAGLFVITTYFSTPANQYQVLEQSQGFTSAVVLVSC